MDQFWGCGWIFRYFGPRCPRRQTARPAYQHFWPHSNWPPIRLDSFCSWESELQIYCHSRDLFLENGCKPNQEYYVWFHVWLRCSDRTPFWNQCCMIAWLQSYEVYHHKIYKHRNVLKLIIVCGKYTYGRVVGPTGGCPPLKWRFISLPLAHNVIIIKILPKQNSIVHVANIGFGGFINIQGWSSFCGDQWGTL